LARYRGDIAIIWPLLTGSRPTRASRLARVVAARIPTAIGVIPNPCAYADASRHYPPPVEVVLVVVGAAVLVVVVVLEVVLVVVVVVQ